MVFALQLSQDKMFHPFGFAVYQKNGEMVCSNETFLQIFLGNLLKNLSKRVQRKKSVVRSNKLKV